MPILLSDEQADDVILSSRFQAEAEVSLLVGPLAENLYYARLRWIGGGMDWRDLTPGQRAGYRQEIEQLIKAGIK